MGHYQSNLDLKEDSRCPNPFLVPHVSVRDKEELLGFLAVYAGRVLGLSEDLILECLLKREEDHNTGVGAGVAMPHAFIDGITKSVGFFCVLKNPIDYNALDDAPVDLVYLILSPLHGGGGHLMMLARAARLFSDHALCATVRGTHQVDALRLIVGHLVGDELA